MGRFIAKCLLLSIPFVVYLAVIYLVDPFERFGRVEIVSLTAKEHVASLSNDALWQVIRFSRDPGDSITLGASKMNNIKPFLLKSVTGIDYRSLATDGGSSGDMIDLFWFAARRMRLKRVVVGVSIESFNLNLNRNQARGAVTTAENPLLYLTNRDVLDSARKLVLESLGGRRATGEPPSSREAFWQEQLTYGATRNFYHFVFDDGAIARFEEVGRYCRANQIELKFVVLPNHSDLHERIRSFGVEAAWRSLPDRLRRIAETHDFDVEGDLTSDRSRYEDPFHFNQATARQIVEQVFRAGKTSDL